METFKSPRKVAEEIRQYKYSRFESYMQQSDDGKLPRALAIAAFSDEVLYIDNPVELNETRTPEDTIS